MTGHLKNCWSPNTNLVGDIIAKKQEEIAYLTNQISVYLKPEGWHDIHVQDLGLSTRTENALTGADILTLADLALVWSTKDSIMTVPGLGSVSQNEIDDLMTFYATRRGVIDI